MKLTMVLGGSTNAVLHSIAMARAFGIDLTIDDWQRVSDQTPMLADFRPSGKYVMEDLHQVGGTPGVIRMLVEAGVLDGSQMTCTGKTLAENVAALPALLPYGHGPGSRTSSTRWTNRSSASATSASCAARSPPAAASPRSPARRARSSPAPPACSTPRRR